MHFMPMSTTYAYLCNIQIEKHFITFYGTCTLISDSCPIRIIPLLRYGSSLVIHPHVLHHHEGTGRRQVRHPAEEVETRY